MFASNNFSSDVNMLLVNASLVPGVNPDRPFAVSLLSLALHCMPYGLGLSVFGNSPIPHQHPRTHPGPVDSTSPEPATHTQRIAIPTQEVTPGVVSYLVRPLSACVGLTLTVMVTSVGRGRLCFG